MDKHLRFNDHVTHIMSKISKSIGIIHKLSNHLPIVILKLLYNTLVLPHLTYGIESWFVAPTYVSERVLVAQERAVRSINNLPSRAHTGAYFKKDRILTIEMLFKFNMGCHVYKILNSGVSLPLSYRFETQSSLHNYATRNSHKL